ncbi:tetratricopeptide repeat protein [Rhodoferax aquaticus]|uniref:Tetratricopeptide repeat protein n=1 Tax=Rhodoferax aquaticus TaxID=2527691 RepID=A0A515EQB6_9BURK|nr:tetratricopeptide repeat protein [Rhodoferax aquaticus]QDL54874.1 tetratricopeptide repeat protein [Rhodoferax aquaticus]
MSLLNSPSTEDLFFQANGLMEHGQFGEAKHLLLQALDQDPDWAEVHANLAYACAELGETVQAEQCYLRALELAPHAVQLHINVGTLLAEQKRLQEAIAHFEWAISLEPDCVAAWSNLGGVYAGMHRNAQAEQCCRRALELDPGHAKARFNLAYVLLRRGDLEEGWACFEARDWYAAMAAKLHAPRWDGSPLAGQSVLLVCEAGYGDVMQFCRYVPVLKHLGASRVSLLCQPPLVRIMQGLEGLDHVLNLNAPLPELHWDCWCPLLSLPFHLQTRLHTIPGTLPYLHATPKRRTLWQSLLPSKGFKVGLVWKGNPRFENDADRSLKHLSVLGPLFQVPGVAFISLQKGVEGAHTLEAPELGDVGHMTAIGERLHDFADTAALVANLDLVITVDTAVAHLTGALNIPCWVLLPHYKTDWRWLQDRSDSPWYPGVMRLFRQGPDEDWAPVVAELTAALHERMGGTP